jgi:hypothetical protein
MMKPGKKHQKLADLLEKGKLVTAFSLMDVPSFSPLSVCAIPLPSKTDSNSRTHANSGISTGLGELPSKKPATTFILDASSLADNPSVSFFHVNPNAQKHKMTNRVKDGRMSGTHADFAGLNNSADQSTESDPRAGSLWELAFDALAAESQKTGLKTADANSSKKPATTFLLDASSLADNPSVSFFHVNNPKAQTHQMANRVKDGRMSGTHADYAAIT